MIIAYNNLDRPVYGCFVAKEKKSKLPRWWLMGKEIVVQGADVYDEICYLAFGDSPEELLVWAKVHGLDIASGAEDLAE